MVIAVHSSRKTAADTGTRTKDKKFDRRSDGSLTPVEGGANGSTKAARMQGKMAAAANIVYAGLGFNLTDPMAPADGSKAKGINFQAKGKGTIRFKLPDVNTAPGGKQCTQCYNATSV